MALPETSDLGGRDVADRAKNVDFLVADLIAIHAHRRFHRHQTENLQEVILDHVAQGARAIVVPSSLLNAHLLRHGDLDVVDIPPIPHRLEQRVRESEGEDILYGFLP